MKNLCAAIATSLFLVFGLSKSAWAETPYAGLFISPVDIEPLNFVALGAKVGYPFNEHLAVELRGLTGIDKDSFLGVDVELESILAGHVRMGGSMTDTFHPYFMLGYARTKVSAAVGEFQASTAGSRFSYGVGFISDVTEHTGFNLELMNYYQGSGNDEIYALTFGLVTKLSRPE